LHDEEQTNLQVADRIAGMLAASNAPFVMIGAIALAAHRYIRFTEDNDLGVLADLPQVSSAWFGPGVEGFASVSGWAVDRYLRIQNPYSPFAASACTGVALRSSAPFCG
jgi:hypothetical protein